MEPTIITEGAAAAEVLDFSLWALFMKADWVVKAVMLLLIVASFWTWAIIIDKSLAFSRLNAKARRFETFFWSGRPLEELYRRIGQKRDHPMAVVFVAAMKEWNRSFDSADDQGILQNRLDRTMSIAMTKELTRIERHLPFLATVGSTAPFVGLFGTVWGIMNAFQAIAVSRDTNLAVVAPGIAEALFATALGLLAAIPAVMAYNNFTGSLNRYATRLETFADEFSGLITHNAGAEPDEEF